MGKWVWMCTFTSSDSVSMIPYLSFADYSSPTSTKIPTDPCNLPQVTQNTNMKGISFLNCSRAYVGVSLDDNNGQEIHSQRGMMWCYTHYICMRMAFTIQATCLDARAHPCRAYSCTYADRWMLNSVQW